MAKNIEETHRALLDAIAFASRVHQGQFRKDRQTPYASHVFRVCLIVRDLFGVSDARILTAAVLHDTLEDTTTDYDDLEKRYGREVAGWVSLLSKDKRLPEKRREKAYCEGLKAATWQVKVCKLADILDNMVDTANLPPERHARVLKNARRYLEALKANLQEEAHRPWVLVSQVLDEHESTVAGKVPARK